MTKDEYTNKRSKLLDDVAQLKLKIKILEEEYISSNIEFKPGEKVKLVYREYKTWEGTVVPETFVYGFLKGYTLDWNGNVKPELVQIKKNGSPSLREIHIYGSDQTYLTKIDDTK